MSDGSNLIRILSLGLLGQLDEKLLIVWLWRLWSYNSGNRSFAGGQNWMREWRHIFWRSLPSRALCNYQIMLRWAKSSINYTYETSLYFLLSEYGQRENRFMQLSGNFFHLPVACNMISDSMLLSIYTSNFLYIDGSEINVIMTPGVI